jgi:hypothetical protein
MNRLEIAVNFIKHKIPMNCLLHQRRKLPNIIQRKRFFIKIFKQESQKNYFIIAVASSVIEDRVTVTLRLPVYRQSVPLGSKPLEAHDHRFFFLNKTLRA